MAYLEVMCQDSVYHITSQDFCLRFKNTPANKKVLCLFLRALRSPLTGKALFTHKQVAHAFGYKRRQNTQNFDQELRQCDGDLLAYLQHKRKVDAEVVQAVTELVRQFPLRKATQLFPAVVARVHRPDLTPANIRTALEQVPCTVIRPILQRQWEAGTFHPKESVVLEHALSALSDSPSIDAKRVTEQLQGLGITACEPCEDEVVQQQHTQSVADLLNPQVGVSQISSRIQLMVLALTLYFWNIPFSRIALWLGVSKSTVYQWVSGLSIALFPIVQAWIVLRVRAVSVSVDEKWLKIKKQWHYWFVCLDEATGLPVHMALLPTRTTWACCWFLVSLRRLGKIPRAVMTDGLKGYAASMRAVFPTAKHLFCLFQQQQGVTRWFREHGTTLPEKTVTLLKRKMKAVVQTGDPRTVRRRLARLKADDDVRQCGLDPWIRGVRARLGHLIPSLRRNPYPRTSNSIERFFRAFQRFYKTRGGFHSVMSTKRELMLFLVVYVFTVQVGTGIAPIERIVPEAKQMPFYKLLNAPLSFGLANMCQEKREESRNLAPRRRALVLKSSGE